MEFNKPAQIFRARYFFSQRFKVILSPTSSSEPLVYGVEFWELMVRVVTQPKLAPTYRSSMGNRPTFLWEGNHLQRRGALTRFLSSILENA